MPGGLLFRNLGARPARLAERNRDGLLTTLYFLAAAGLELALFVLLHDLVNLALTFGTAPRSRMRIR